MHTVSIITYVIGLFELLLSSAQDRLGTLLEGMVFVLILFLQSLYLFLHTHLTSLHGRGAAYCLFKSMCRPHMSLNRPLL